MEEPFFDSIGTKFPKTGRPRERLIIYGEKVLSNQELLAILLRTGSKTQNVMELSTQVLKYFDGLYQLKNATVEELQRVKGIGLVKSLELKAAFELGMRLAYAEQLKYGKVSSSGEIAEIMMNELKNLDQEHLYAIYLNTKNEIIKKELVFKGSLNQSIAHPREIFKGAVRCSAAKIILVHNHPSGNPEASKMDIQFTRRIANCGELMGIDLLDHLIIGHKSYQSLRDLEIF